MRKKKTPQAQDGGTKKGKGGNGEGGVTAVGEGGGKKQNAQAAKLRLDNAEE